MIVGLVALALVLPPLGIVVEAGSAARNAIAWAGAACLAAAYAFASPATARAEQTLPTRRRRIARALCLGFAVILLPFTVGGAKSLLMIETFAVFALTSAAPLFTSFYENGVFGGWGTLYVVVIVVAAPILLHRAAHAAQAGGPRSDLTLRRAGAALVAIGAVGGVVAIALLRQDDSAVTITLFAAVRWLDDVLAWLSPTPSGAQISLILKAGLACASAALFFAGGALIALARPEAHLAPAPASR